jgi:hypothetical protein
MCILLGLMDACEPNEVVTFALQIVYGPMGRRRACVPKCYEVRAYVAIPGRSKDGQKPRTGKWLEFIE